MKDEFINNIISNMKNNFNYILYEVNDSRRLIYNWGLLNTEDNLDRHLVAFIKSENIVGADSDRDDGYLAIKELGLDNITPVIVFKDANDFNSNVDAFKTFANRSNIIGKMIIIDERNRSIVHYDENVKNVAKQVAFSLAGIHEKSRSSFIPWVTYMLIAVNVLVFIAAELLTRYYLNKYGENYFTINAYTNPSDIAYNYVLILMGAKYNPGISSGEYYRLVTSMFLHGGLVHIGLNMFSLYNIGPLIERIYGRYKYLMIYFIAGIIGSLASYIFSTDMSIGASGAIFGLMGAALVFAFKARNRIGKEFLRSVASVIVVNLIMGFSIPNIDNYAHLGGLLSGAAAAWALGITKK